jgi:hypothetical protein
MTEPIIIAIITGTSLIMVSIIAGFFALWTHQQKTFHAVNGRMEELLALTKSMARVEAVDEERERVAEKKIQDDAAGTSSAASRA